MNDLTAPFLAAAGLLVAAGSAKLAAPTATAQALRTQGLPSAVLLVRVLGVAEVAMGLGALLEVRFAAALMGLTYAAFTVFVVVPVLRGRPLRSCGCFAEPDLPPSGAHVLVTAAMAGCAAAVAVGPPAGLAALSAQPGPRAAAVLVSAAAVGWLAYLVLTGLPRLSPASPVFAASPVSVVQLTRPEVTP